MIDNYSSWKWKDAGILAYPCDSQRGVNSCATPCLKFITYLHVVHTLSFTLRILLTFYILYAEQFKTCINENLATAVFVLVVCFFVSVKARPRKIPYNILRKTLQQRKSLDGISQLWNKDGSRWSARFPPLWPRFDSLNRWCIDASVLNLLVVLCIVSRVSLPPQKPSLQISIQPGKGNTKTHPVQIPK